MPLTQLEGESFCLPLRSSSLLLDTKDPGAADKRTQLTKRVDEGCESPDAMKLFGKSGAERGTTT